MKVSAQGWLGGEPKKRRGDAPHAEFVSYSELLEFDGFVLAMEPELRRFLSRKVSAEAVDDLLQEIWIAAWQSLPTYDRKSKLRTWIYAIALHKCYDHYRSRRAEERTVALDALPIVDPHPSPESVAVQADTIGRLLGELDETQRDVLELYYYAQLTLAEISAVLDRNPNTVKYQFYRAHATMLAAGEREGLR